MKIIKKLLFFFSLLLIYLVVKELLVLYTQVSNIHPIAGYILLGVLAATIIYFVIIPVTSILLIPPHLGPTYNINKEQELIKKRIELYRNNPYLKQQDFDFSSIENTRESYNVIVKILEKECSRIRERHVTQLFYSTSIIQNGFLDALFILSASINHIKDIFILYNGRITNRDLWKIFRKIYYSMAVGGSEGVEYATEEIISKFATDSMKSIPFLDKILSSLADGFVNATLLTRISLITENYCKMTYIRNDRELYPSVGFITASVKHITADMINRIFKTMRNLGLKFAVNKTLDFTLVAINPIGYVLGKSIEKNDALSEERKEKLKNHARLVGNPLAYGLEKLIRSLRKKK